MDNEQIEEELAKRGWGRSAIRRWMQENSRTVEEIKASTVSDAQVVANVDRALRESGLEQTEDYELVMTPEEREQDYQRGEKAADDEVGLTAAEEGQEVRRIGGLDDVDEALLENFKDDIREAVGAAREESAAGLDETTPLAGADIGQISEAVLDEWLEANGTYLAVSLQTGKPLGEVVATITSEIHDDGVEQLRQYIEQGKAANLDDPFVMQLNNTHGVPINEINSIIEIAVAEQSFYGDSGVQKEVRRQGFETPEEWADNARQYINIYAGDDPILGAYGDPGEYSDMELWNAVMVTGILTIADEEVRDALVNKIQPKQGLDAMQVTFTMGDGEQVSVYAEEYNLVKETPGFQDDTVTRLFWEEMADIFGDDVVKYSSHLAAHMIESGALKTFHDWTAPQATQVETQEPIIVEPEDERWRRIGLAVANATGLTSKYESTGRWSGVGQAVAELNETAEANPRTGERANTPAELRAVDRRQRAYDARAEARYGSLMTRDPATRAGFQQQGYRFEAALATFGRPELAHLGLVDPEMAHVIKQHGGPRSAEEAERVRRSMEDNYSDLALMRMGWGTNNTYYNAMLTPALGAGPVTVEHTDARTLGEQFRETYRTMMMLEPSQAEVDAYVAAVHAGETNEAVARNRALDDAVNVFDDNLPELTPERVQEIIHNNSFDPAGEKMARIRTSPNYRTLYSNRPENMSEMDYVNLFRTKIGGVVGADDLFTNQNIIHAGMAQGDVEMAERMAFNQNAISDESVREKTLNHIKLIRSMV